LGGGRTDSTIKRGGLSAGISKFLSNTFEPIPKTPATLPQQVRQEERVQPVVLDARAGDRSRLVGMHQVQLNAQRPG
jgi:hypothetical protein